jgi:hypothetical protein
MGPRLRPVARKFSALRIVTEHFRRSATPPGAVLSGLLSQAADVYARLAVC